MAEVFVKNGVKHRIDSAIEISDPEEYLEHILIDATCFTTNGVHNVSLKDKIVLARAKT